MSTESPTTIHVLYRFNWRRSYPEGFSPIPGKTRVASYPDLTIALQERDKRESECRALLNPFELGNGLAALTSFPPEIFHDWLIDADLDAPAPTPKDRYPWLAWWKQNHHKMTQEQKAKVWQALNKVRFYEVCERPALPIVYAVVSVTWNYNDQWHYALEEGGEIETVFRSRKNAEAYCARINEETRADWDSFSDDDAGLEMSTRLHFQAGPFAHHSQPREDVFVRPQDAPFYEVVEIEWEE